MPAHVSYLFPGYLAPIGTFVDLQHQRVIRAFASSIGHNHGLFDEA